MNKIVAVYPATF